MKTPRTAIRLLRQFSATETELGVSELARRLSVDKATSHRLLKSLEAERFVEQNLDTRRYRLGVGLLEMASTCLARFPLARAAPDHLHDLRRRTGESVGLYLHDGTAMVLLAASEAGSEVQGTPLIVGERQPLVSETGLAHLATLGEDAAWASIEKGATGAVPYPMPAREMIDRKIAEIRRLGYCIAARDNGATNGCAVSVGGDRPQSFVLRLAGPRTRVDDAALAAHARAMTEAASRLRSILAGMPSESRPSTRRGRRKA